MPERMVCTNGVELWTESLGDEGDPAILLVAGASGQGITWHDDLCAMFVEGGRRVLRYDHRDTGRSTCFDFSRDPYTLDDLARDALGVLDGWGIDSAHVVGGSMGGMIAQLLAIEHPDRVLTLTSLISSPSGSEAAGSVHGMEGGGDPLPGPRPEFVAAFSEVLANPPTTRDEHVAAGVRMAAALAGGGGPFDEAGARAMVEAQYDRAVDWAAANNHALAVATAPSRTSRLAAVRCPTLVVHGTEDPAFPLEHGKATADAIPGASLLVVEGMGHELPRWAWRQVVDAILGHTEM